MAVVVGMMGRFGWVSWLGPGGWGWVGKLDAARLAGLAGLSSNDSSLFSLLFAFRVRWVEDVCVRGVGSRERAVVGVRTCETGQCTRV